MRVAAEKLETNGRPKVCVVLSTALAETAVATMMAQKFHWNVTGMNFDSLHKQFQEVYEDHFVGQADLAERIKALDGYAHGKLARALKRSSIAELQGVHAHGYDCRTIGRGRDAGGHPQVVWRAGSRARRYAYRRFVHRARTDARKICMDTARPPALIPPENRLT